MKWFWFFTTGIFGISAFLISLGILIPVDRLTGTVFWIGALATYSLYRQNVLEKKLEALKALGGKG